MLLFRSRVSKGAVGTHRHHEATNKRLHTLQQCGGEKILHFGQCGDRRGGARTASSQVNAEMVEGTVPLKRLCL